MRPLCLFNRTQKDRRPIPDRPSRVLRRALHHRPSYLGFLYREEINLEDYVYRYIPIHRFWEIMESKEIVFMRLRKFEDPFEGFLTKRLFKAAKEDYDSWVKLRYFLCCTAHRERDHDWRNYTPNRDGVRLKISVNELKKSCKSHGNVCKEIQYLTSKEVAELVKKLDRDIYSGKVDDLFFYKRTAFKDEKEFRFSIQTSHRKSFFGMKIEPEKAIRSLLFDPRMSSKVFELHKKFILSTWPYLKIGLSNLYDPERAIQDYL